MAKYAFNSLYEAFEVETGTCPLALAQADVSLAKTDGPDPVAIGSQLTYTLTVTNETTENFATGLVVTDTLPGDVAFKSATPSQGTVDPVTGAEVIWNVGELSGGQSETLKILVIVDPSTLDGTILTNTATVEGAQLDPDTSNNSLGPRLYAGDDPQPCGRHPYRGRPGRDQRSRDGEPLEDRSKRYGLPLLRSVGDNRTGHQRFNLEAAPT